MAEPENPVLVLLREGSADMDRRHEDVQAPFAALHKRRAAMHLNGIKALKGFVGHGSMAGRATATFEIEVSELNRRAAALEATRP